MRVGAFRGGGLRLLGVMDERRAVEDNDCCKGNDDRERERERERVTEREEGRGDD
jgi:hypothetical protein